MHDEAEYYEDDEEEPKTAYYIWLPFLLVACMGLAKLPRTLWKILEGGLIDNILDSKNDKIAENLVRQKRCKSFFGKHKFFFYHWSFAFCEVGLLVTSSISIGFTVV